HELVDADVDVNVTAETLSYHQIERNRIAVLEHFVASPISDNEFELLVQVLNRPDVQNKLPRHSMVRTPSPLEEPRTSSTSRNQFEDRRSRGDDHFDSEGGENEQNRSERSTSRTSRVPHRAESTPGAMRASVASLRSLNLRHGDTSEGGLLDDFTLQGTGNLLPDKE